MNINDTFEEQTHSEYLHAFFEEKSLPVCAWTIVDKSGLPHIIGSDFVIQTILHTCDDSEQNLVAVTLRKLDFWNAPVLPFLRHLAEALVMKGYTQLAGWESGEWMEEE